MSADIRSVVVAHPVRTSLVVAPTLAFFALSPTPHLVSVIALVATLQVWSWSFVFRTKDHWHGLPQLLAVAFAGALASLRSSLGALSTPSTSMIVLSAITSATSLVALSVLVGAARFDRLASTPWSKITLFPAVWASTWGFVSYVSPVGQLATWSPVLGLGSYQWIRQFMGQVGIDWIVAAWAAVASEIIGDWLVGSPTHAEDENPQVMLIDPDGIQETPNALPQPSHSLSHRSIAKLSLTAFLITLMLPSNFLYDTPLPAHSPETTYFTVGCALPLPHRTGHRIALPTLDDYILETKRLQSPANIVLWPETAVRFDSPAAKEEAFSKIQDVMNHGKYVGVSFEDYVPSEVKDGVSRRAMRRNGFALIGFKGEPVLEYYKRNLVPIAESYHFTPGNTAPAIFTIDLKPPKTVRGPDWAPEPNFTRPIPITASICLDFSSSSTFEHLESRPALILAPASTWHTGIGYAMWEQAKARAAETGSPIVWCDGGEGGVGGIVGGGYNEIVQVGEGSWTKSIGIEWPFNERRTSFQVRGKSWALSIVWAVVGAGWVVERIAATGARRRYYSTSAVSFVFQWIDRVRDLRRGRVVLVDEEQDLLH